MTTPALYPDDRDLTTADLLVTDAPQRGQELLAAQRYLSGQGHMSAHPLVQQAARQVVEAFEAGVRG